MIIRFDWELNLAFVERNQRENLVQILNELQSKNEQEIVVTVDRNFPSCFLVKIDSDKLLVFWEFEKLAYRVLSQADAFHVQDSKTGIVSIMSRAEVVGMPKRRLEDHLPKMPDILELVTNEISLAQACADADDSFAAWGYLLNVNKILRRAISISKSKSESD